jgi:hypothetical protein
MIEAPSLEAIKRRLKDNLPYEVSVTKREPLIEFGWTTTFGANRPIRYQTVQVSEERNSKLIGILLCHPKTSLAKSEIVDQLAHFNERSGEALDLFCAGYGAYWPPEHHADQKAVTSIRGTEWYFSECAFSKVIDELESETKWKHSGETELILMTARKTSAGEAELDFQSALVCNLEAMLQAKAFTSVRAFFTDIFNYAKTTKQANPTWGFSDNRAINLGRSALKEAVLSLLPKSLSDAYARGEHYAVRSIARDV